MFEDRLIVVTTPITGDEEAVLRFSSMTGEERMSQCYRYKLRVVSGDLEIKAEELLGESVTVEVRGTPEDTMPIQYFNGIVEKFAFVGFDLGMPTYELELVPIFWFMSKTSDNRIFQEMSSVDIIKKLFDEYGFSNYRDETAGTAVRGYCVQYGETDLNFVQRLMEEDGLFYFFEHANGEHTLVMTDTPNSCVVPEQYDVFPFWPEASFTMRDDHVITRFWRSAQVVTARYTQQDYDFEKPSANLMSTSSQGRPHSAHSDYEKYEYPGGYTETADGDDISDVRIREDVSQYFELQAKSNSRGPRVGSRITMTDFPRESENGDYIVLGARFEMHDGQYFSGPTADGNDGYAVDLVLMPAETEYRPPRITPKSVMRGPQTAQVVGPAGEEIYTDEYSRVKVQFHWDREGQRDENTTCWIRVSSVWAGSGWGFIQIPRIGQEVIVDFLEGDPDQPIITGRVYNAEQMPPYGLPAEATKSGWKSNSSKGGGGWNELMFEDKKGEELVYFQAEKDHDELVKNNETRHIGNDWEEDVVRNARQWVGGWRDETVDLDKKTHVKQNRNVNIDLNDTEVVGVNRSLSVGSNEDITVGINSTETIGAMHFQTVGASQTITVGAARTDTVGMMETRNVGADQINTIGASRVMSVGGPQTHTIGATDDWTIGSNQTEEIGGTQSTKIAKDQDTKVGKNRVASVGENDSMTIGKDMEIVVGKNLVVKATDSITFTCGKANIQMQKNGEISISGKDITANGKGKITIKASSDVTIKGSKINQN